MSKLDFNRLDLLLKEIQDPYVQENFYRLKLFLQQAKLSGGGVGNVVTNITTSASVWEKAKKTVPASSTTIVESFALSSFRSLEYIINVKDTTSDKEKQLKLSVVKDDGSLKDCVYAIMGSAISLEINANINGLSYELEMINNELFAVEVSFARLTIT